MKVAVLTLHRCINYGSYWQAWCLLDTLRRRGHEPMLLDARSRRIDRAEWRCALRPVLPSVVPREDHALYRARTRRFVEAIDALPRSRPFALERPEEADPCELVIVGSDEVWNPWHPWYGGAPLFLGAGLRAQRLVAYAACCGHYPAARGLPEGWREPLLGFEQISVRGANTRRLLKEGVDIDVPIVLDPCLLVPAAPDEEPPVDVAYAVVYGHNFSPSFADAMRRAARARELRLVSVGYRNDWADTQWLSAGPHEFMGVVQRARAVVTNFFHGCVFALRHGKPFACELSTYRAIKMSDLLALLDAQTHVLLPDASVPEAQALLVEPPGDATQQALAELREASHAWLDRVVPPQEPACPAHGMLRA